MRSREREVRGVVVKVSKGCRYPGIFIVAGCTVVAEACLLVVRIGRLVVVFDMTTGTGVRCTGIAIRMTARTVVSNRCMCPTQYIDLIVDREAGRTPPRICRMAGRAICTDAQLLVIGIGRLVEVILMAAHTFGGGAGITIAMTIYTSH